MTPRTRLAVALTCCVCLFGCGSKAPTAPATVTGTVGARIDSTCGNFANHVTSVTVTIDGLVAGSAAPGGAVTKIVPIGTHSVSGRADTGITWSGDVVVTTAANPDGIKFFACI